MSEPGPAGPSARWLWLTGLMFVLVAAGLEIHSIFLIPQNWERLLSPIGLPTVLTYVVLLISGLTALLLNLFAPVWRGRLIQLPASSAWIRWGLALGLLLAPAWFYLYSPWQEVLPGPWTQFLFALVLVQWISLLIAPRRAPFGWEAVGLALGLFLYPRVVLELRALIPSAFVYRSAVILGLIINAGWSILFLDEGREAARESLVRWRNQQVGLRSLLLLILPLGQLILYVLVGPRAYITNPSLRFFLLLIEFWLMAFLLQRDERQLVSSATLVVSALALSLVSAFVQGLLLVMDDPFSLTWSEGNRFYDYSLVFGQGLYNHIGTIVDPYNTPARYTLWGWLFLLPGAPIEVHRLWNLLLGMLLPILIGLSLVRRVQGPLLRLGLSLWIALFFIVEAPLHPPFMLAALIASLFLFDSSLVRRGISLVFASLYAGLSRWTWIPAAAAFGILADLILYYPSRKGTVLQRLMPTLLLGLLVFLPGLVAGYPNIAPSVNIPTFKQPLLWYRLLPNPTFPLGVLFSTVLFSGPLVMLLVWWIASRRWSLDWIQQTAITAALVGFLGAGLVVSMKIGGGADLHNLDMYLMTLVLVTALGIQSMPAGSLGIKGTPFFAQLAGCLLILLPLYGFTSFPADASYNLRLDVPDSKEIHQTLDQVRTEVSAAQQKGPVLFMDQRQLLTFQYIRGLPLVPEYEKKYMMDQASAANSIYFQGYYRDLATRRFSLIVTEVLRTRGHNKGDFSEENNNWVQWVSEPTLCFYEPLKTFDDLNVQLLVPRRDTSACQQYLK